MTRATLTATIGSEEDAYVSLCPELGVASSGNTPAAALEQLREAVERYLENTRLVGLWEDVRPALEAAQRYTAPLEVRVA